MRSQKEHKRDYYLKNRDRILARKRLLHVESPWKQHYNALQQRCENPDCIAYSGYGGKGIKNLITPKEIRFLWERDKAYLLRMPSIDRIDSKGHYEISNCRFIELSENASHPGELNGRAVLDKETVLRIRRRYHSPRTYKEIAREFGVSFSQVACIITNKNWTYV